MEGEKEFIQEQSQADTETAEEKKEDEFEGNLTHKEELKDIENIAEVREWFKKELESFEERRSDYITGSIFEDIVREIADHLAERTGRNPDDPPAPDVTSDYETTYKKFNEFDEGTTRGSVSFMGEKIFDYSSLADGYNASIDEWYDNALEEALEKYLSSLKGDIKI